MMPNKTQLRVEAINNGTVIDHIPANIGVKVLKLFQMDKTAERVTIGLNLPSSALGAKDLLKIENTFVTPEQASKLSLYAPHATVNQIENYEVVKKIPLVLPSQITGVFECPNSNCITHGEPVDSSFKVITKKDDIHLKCKYCEKVYSREVVTDLN